MSRKKSRSKHKPRKKRGAKWAEYEPLPFDQDENFYFIVGYTDGGAPYGITWEEHEAELEETRKRNNIISFEEAGPIPIIEMRMTQRQWDELVAVYGYHRYEVSCFLNVETGEIAMLSDDDPREEDEELRLEIAEGLNEIYFRVPHPDFNERHELMCEFALSVSSRKLRVKLERALRAERKVFRRFKNALAENKVELERYHSFVEESNRERVQVWLESIGVRAVVVP
ncbi:hypothetical protein ABD76_01165 [Paenibacillus dendritiformis]|uniref:UPF0158 family protein n=1 Tax=Paenibacillus dendritiformis TaxID=130049 RepID=UPI0018CDB46F|nr:UPF0158 family protein [Paenibacillus dendritiformis]MBG9791218.1 hypothetical protein [Paenibacillus dendritiformis]